MSIQLVILGTNFAIWAQTRKIKELIVQAGLTGFDESYTYINIWSKFNDDAKSLFCKHLKIDGGAIMGAQTTPEVRRFMKEAMKLPGVYDACPECCKRRIWEENERIPEHQPVG